MKAYINGWEIEGTPEELRDFVKYGMQDNEKQQKHEAQQKQRNRPKRKMNRDKYNRHCTGWTTQDDLVLDVMTNAGKSRKEISRMLGRSVKAVAMRQYSMAKYKKNLQGGKKDGEQVKYEV